ncbi:MAG: aldolase/citrate lyase family protein [Chloroflexi bacterium]|jgi:2-keto-3-deoxy-L-rhamnonate aldolase RhmA|nr:aldolase/citrate lyase family protein [Chloroflexota bacterium]
MSAPTFVADARALFAAGGAVGTWVSAADPTVAEVLAGAGLDFLAIDGEHGVVDAGSLGPILAAIRAHGLPTLFRVAENEQARIQHALDAGAGGVIVPRVRSAADAARAAAATRYPPEGTRGIAPRRASGYGRDAGYLARANGLVACVVQVETGEALEDLAAILATPGVDALLVGPNDLAGSLGHTGDIDHPENLAAIERVRAAAVAAAMPVGIHVRTGAEARARLAEGFAFATVATDVGLLAAAADALAREATGA